MPDETTYLAPVRDMALRYAEWKRQGRLLAKEFSAVLRAADAAAVEHTQTQTAAGATAMAARREAGRNAIAKAAEPLSRTHVYKVFGAADLLSETTAVLTPGADDDYRVDDYTLRGGETHVWIEVDVNMFTGRANDVPDNDDDRYAEVRQQWQQHVAEQLARKLHAAGLMLKRVPDNAEDPVDVLAVGVHDVAVVRIPT